MALFVLVSIVSMLFDVVVCKVDFVVSCVVVSIGTFVVLVVVVSLM